MSEITNQATVLSNSPLKGFYKYGKFFQLLPPRKQNELFQHDHPLVIEIRFDEDIYPERSSTLWHRDVWEQERFEFIRRRSSRDRMDPSDPWVKAYQEQTRRLRYSAILNEVCNLLTLFTHHRFFLYGGKQGWFVPIQPHEQGKDPVESIWGQPGFISGHEGTITTFTEATCDDVPTVPVSEYIKRFRDARDCTREHQIEFPDTIDLLLDTYFSLSDIKKTAYFMACHLYNQALLFQNTTPSLSMVAAVMAIEKLMNAETESTTSCRECGASESIEHCTTCNAPIYRARSRFRNFMASFSLPDQDRLYRDMYDIRSRLAHGGLLREDLFDTGFYAGEKDNEDRLRRNSLIAVHDALLHWLIRSADVT